MYNNNPATAGNVKPFPLPSAGAPTLTPAPSLDAPSVEKRWADHLLGEKTYPWYVDAQHTSGAESVYQWNGVHLRYIGAEEGKAIAGDWLDRYWPGQANDSRASACWSYGAKRLRTQRPMPKPSEGRTIIPCADVYLELHRDGRITALAPDPALGMTYAINLNAGTVVGKNHTLSTLPASSRFRAFIERALPDSDVRALVQEQCGLTLLSTRYQIASWWVGKAGSGKSTLAAVCKAMQRQVASIRLHNLSERFGLEVLVGASLVTVDEVEPNERWPEGLWKSLVGGNGVSVDRKNEKAILSYESTAKWLLCSNCNPPIRDRSDGVWRRLCIVPFDVVIPQGEQVPDFHNVLLRQEGKAILDWMLEGAQRIVMRGGFLEERKRPHAVQHLKEAVRNECDSVRAWMGANEVRTGSYTDDWAPKDDVYAHYEQWCKDAHATAVERNLFWKNLRQYLPDLMISNRRVGKKQRYVCNVVCCDADDADPLAETLPSSIPISDDGKRAPIIMGTYDEDFGALFVES